MVIYICFNLKQRNATDKAAPVLCCPGLGDLVYLLQLPPDGGDVLVEVLQRPLPPEGVLGPGGGAGARCPLLPGSVPAGVARRNIFVAQRRRGV